MISFFKRKSPLRALIFIICGLGCIYVAFRLAKPAFEAVGFDREPSQSQENKQKEETNNAKQLFDKLFHVNDKIEYQAYSELDEDVIDYLVQRKDKTNEERIEKILHQLEKYPDEIKELILRNFETLDYVADYPDRELFINTPIVVEEEELSQDILPLFMQWDRRWGYQNYKNRLLAIAGCGPTSLSMVASGLLKDPNLHPLAIADFSVENGHVTEDNSTKWTLMTEGARKLGLYSKEVPLDQYVIFSHLNAGRPVILSTSLPTFTSSGHMLVLVEAFDDGMVRILDCNSPDKTAQLWPFETFLEGTKNCWAFSSEPF